MITIDVLHAVADPINLTHHHVSAACFSLSVIPMTLVMYVMRVQVRQDLVDNASSCACAAPPATGCHN